jgi:7-cyano-7-deazaguanine synthase
MTERAVILLSGGVDSTTTLAMAAARGFMTFAMSFDYGQRHRVELDAAARVARSMGVSEHLIARVNLNEIGASALTANIEVPKDRSAAEIDSRIPVTYVPARNTVFLSLALAWAEAIDSRDIFIGVNALDYSGYPDCRPEYIEAFTRVANLGTKAGVEGKDFRIHTPLISLTKGQIVTEGLKLGVDFSLTHSCYDPDTNGKPCRRCDSCLLRLKGFEEAGIKDPQLEIYRG